MSLNQQFFSHHVIKSSDLSASLNSFTLSPFLWLDCCDTSLERLGRGFRGFGRGGICFADCSNLCRTIGEVVSGVVAKCLSATKQKTKEKGMEIIMLYFELDKPDAVQVSMTMDLRQKNHGL